MVSYSSSLQKLEHFQLFSRDSGQNSTILGVDHPCLVRGQGPKVVQDMVMSPPPPKKKGLYREIYCIYVLIKSLGKYTGNVGAFDNL